MAAGLIRRRILGLLAAGLLSACAATPAPAPAPVLEPNPDAVSRLFLVRHGEKEAGSDPALSVAGVARAATLAALLQDEGVTEVWSTQTRRTEQTAAPTAAEFGLPIQIYDASTLPAFASWLLDTPGVKLVVGHSNTTDALAALLGADAGPEFVEATEFDRLYVIDIDANGVVRSRIVRYGTPSVSAAGGAE
jgi:2,3-bisphosphoglycerate-dependent phosphoglycerate mutase